MTLTFNVLKDNKVATSIDIVVDKASTVKKCLLTAVEKLSLQGKFNMLINKIKY